MTVLSHQVPPKPPLEFRDLPSLPAIETLKARAQWLGWEYQLKTDAEGNQCWTKPPLDAKSGRLGSSTGQGSWADFETAAAFARRRPGTGVGFALSKDDDLSGVDLDHCRDAVTGMLEPWAQDVVDLAETYCEISPSGTGLRMFAKGKVAKALAFKPAGVEIYSSGRYLTLTGRHIAGTPTEIRPAPKTLAALEVRVISMKPQIVQSPISTAQPIAKAGSLAKAVAGEKSPFFRNVNDAALADLGAWFPVLFPNASFQTGTSGYRVSSRDLGRKLEEDLSATPQGIKDWGIWDMGDANGGARTPITVLIEHGNASDAVEAAHWLCDRLGRDPASLGWQDKPQRPRSRSPEASSVDASDILEPDSGVLTQDRVALIFAEKAEGKLRYCHSSGAWLRWTGVYWRRDETHQAFSFARELARQESASGTAAAIKEARKVSFAGGVERFAQADSRLAVTHVAWDVDPLLLGTPDGTVDLRTGQLRPADPADGITKTTAVGPSDTADCPQWLAFLDQATRGDAELIRFLRQWCGYCLTGLTKEHALVFVYGGGGNGKSVALNTITHILNDYAATSAMDTFTASRNDRHSTELAMLRGARIVTASETEEGRAWAEARIKQVTGGDPVTCRFMRQDNFTYLPAFKLFVIGNHAPVLHNVDDAARRRFNIVPFIHKPTAPDRDLETKIRAEAPGILRWMIEGCLDWQANGLIRPAVVEAATATYFNDQDLFGQWLEDECRLEPGNPHLWELVKDLFASWSDYARAAGDEPGSAKTFAARMERAGCPRGKASKGARKHSGVRLLEKQTKADAGHWMDGEARF